MEAIFHIIGLCGDNNSHIDLLDILITLGGGSIGAITVKTYYKTVVYIIKEKLKIIYNILK